MVYWKKCRFSSHRCLKLYRFLEHFHLSNCFFSSISAEHSVFYPWDLNLVYVSKEARIKLMLPYHNWAELGIWCFLQQLMWCPVVLCCSCNSVAKTELSSVARLLIFQYYFRLGLKFLRSLVLVMLRNEMCWIQTLF